MEYSKIIAVTGLPGLHELISSKTDGAIVRSLEDKSTKFVSSRIHNFSHLESIEVYTAQDNVNLVTVFEAMTASAEKLPDEKDAKAVRAYFEKVYPDMDFERVYNSDMKKMVRWYAVLKANDVEIKLREPEEPVAAPEPEAEEKPAAKAAPAKEKPARAAKAKPAEKEAPAKETEKAAPKKKTAAKSATKSKPAEEKPEKEAPRKKAASKSAKPASKSATKKK